MVMDSVVFVPGDSVVSRGGLNRDMFVVDRGMAVMNLPGKVRLEASL